MSDITSYQMLINGEWVDAADGGMFDSLNPADGKHIRTKPYSPKTNGKAERFIQSSLREWACGRAGRTSEQRKAALPYRLHHYNRHRPHAGIKRKPPKSPMCPSCRKRLPLLRWSECCSKALLVRAGASILVH